MLSGGEREERASWTIASENDDGSHFQASQPWIMFTRGYKHSVVKNFKGRQIELESYFASD